MKIQLDFWAVLAEWPILLLGVGWTLALTIAAVLVGTSLGIACAWVRALGFGNAQAPTWLKALVGGYVEAIRNTPFIIQLFFIFFGLPAIGLKLSAESASFLSPAGASPPPIEAKSFPTARAPPSAPPFLAAKRAAPLIVFPPLFFLFLFPFRSQSQQRRRALPPFADAATAETSAAASCGLTFLLLLLPLLLSSLSSETA